MHFCARNALTRPIVLIDPTLKLFVVAHGAGDVAGGFGQDLAHKALKALAELRRATTQLSGDRLIEFKRDRLCHAINGITPTRTPPAGFSCDNRR